MPPQSKRPKLPSPPHHSLDPADWFMYCDLLQDAGAGKTTWRRAQKIAESLRESPGLLLVVCEGLMARWMPMRVCLPRNVNLGRILAWLKPAWETARQLIESAKPFEHVWVTSPLVQDGPADEFLRLHSFCRQAMEKAFFNSHSLQKDPAYYSSITF